MLIVNERARATYLRIIGIHQHTHLTIKSEVYEAFVNPEVGSFYTQITLNLLLYLMFHERGLFFLLSSPTFTNLRFA